MSYDNELVQKLREVVPNIFLSDLMNVPSRSGLTYAELMSCKNPGEVLALINNKSESK
jgi:hypothetical protein